MKKLTSKQVQEISKLAKTLGDFGFSNVEVNLNSRWFITAERDFLSDAVVHFIPRTWCFYYDGKELSISFA